MLCIYVHFVFIWVLQKTTPIFIEIRVLEKSISHEGNNIAVNITAKIKYKHPKKHAPNKNCPFYRKKFL